MSSARHLCQPFYGISLLELMAVFDAQYGERPGRDFPSVQPEAQHLLIASIHDEPPLEIACLAAIPFRQLPNLHCKFSNSRLLLPFNHNI